MEHKKTDNEETLYQAHPSMFRNHPLWFVIVFLFPICGFALMVYLGLTSHLLAGVYAFAIPIAISLLTYGVWLFEIKGTTLTITNDRSTLRKGLLSKRVSEVWHQDVRNVQLDQSFLQRILGVGRIGISSAADAGKEIDVNGMPDPEKIKGIIDQHRRRDRTNTND